MGRDSGGVNRRSVLKTIGAGAVAATGSVATSGTAAADESDEHYHNPVGPIGFGDVTVIRDQREDSDAYYAYGTETPQDIVPIAKSDDLANWEYIAPALESSPDWRDEEDAGVWAPDINYYDGQYHLYYSYSTWGSQDNPGIGLATADSPDGPFEDQGPVFRNEDLGMTNCIDGEFRVVDGTPYMIWGSWYGIHGVELTDSADDYVPGTTFHLAGDKREGGMIVEENGYYYLFYSTGHCCDGYDSTYEVEVGRAESFTGPYYNQNGTDLRDLNEHRNGVAVLSGTDRFTGPGHNTAYQDENGDWWMLYHVEATAEREVRTMMVDRIQWDEDDWPVVACNGHPSAKSPMPGSGEFDCESDAFESSVSAGTATAASTAGAPTSETQTATPAETATSSGTGDGMSVLGGVAALGAAAVGALGSRGGSEPERSDE
ncbi:family 43 glycosylhydrolase [Halosimplex aquaticum]|uniref:Family 43 glycosylhydrolase n=1 Tax=Halosimplex aquaticum TaxID=3026162 RepID=A0ABD5Y176_9EURY